MGQQNNPIYVCDVWCLDLCPCPFQEFMLSPIVGYDQ